MDKLMTARQSGNSDDPEKSSNVTIQRKLLARDMLQQTNEMKKTIEELSENLEEITKSEK
jgi:hypothetical protein